MIQSGIIQNIVEYDKAQRRATDIYWLCAFFVCVWENCAHMKYCFSCEALKQFLKASQGKTISVTQVTAQGLWLYLMNQVLDPP